MLRKVFFIVIFVRVECLQKRKLWKDDDMVKAMKALKDDGVSLRSAAINFNVPRKTLEDSVKGKTQHGVKPGPRTVLTMEEEDSLVLYLVYMSKCGFPLTRTMIKAFAWAISKRSGTSERFHHDIGPCDLWWRNLIKQHTQLSLRKTDAFE